LNESEHVTVLQPITEKPPPSKRTTKLTYLLAFIF